MKYLISCLMALIVLPLSASAAPKKSALIFVNWSSSATAFANAALAAETQLKKLGWDVYLFSSVQSDQLTIQFTQNGKTKQYLCPVASGCGWEDIVMGLFDDSTVKSGDQFLFDIEGDGTTIYASGMTLADGSAVGLPGLGLDINTVLSYEENAQSFQYPIGNTRMLSTHLVEAFLKGQMNFTYSNYLLDTYGGNFYLPRNFIATGDLSNLAAHYSNLGAKVTVIDHSCQGGATVKVLEANSSTSICAISTTGINSPGIQGTPPLSDFLSHYTTTHRPKMSDYTTYVSNFFYNTPEYHPAAARIHQAGFSNGCTQTMAVRELADNATGAYSTWWDWSRTRPSHVVRNPKRYAYESLDNLSPDQPWTAASVGSTFTDDCAKAGKNCNLTTNPRLKIAEGWNRWFSEQLTNFENTILNDGSMTHTEITQDLAKLKNDGTNLVDQVNAQGKLVDELDAALVHPLNRASYYGAPVGSVDEYLRQVFIERCLCPQPAAVKKFNLTCATGSARYPVPTGWTDEAICKKSVQFVTEVLKPITAKGRGRMVFVEAPLALLNRIEARETGTGPGGTGILGELLVQVGLDLQPFEKACRSAACEDQEF